MEPLKSANLIPVSITDSAMREVERLFDSGKEKSNSLRFGVKSAGCAGFSYVFEFDEKVEDDKMYMLNDKMNLIIHPNHLMYLQGCVIDYENGLNNRGFIFKNPNAETTCGCGSSFG